MVGRSLLPAAIAASLLRGGCLGGGGLATDERRPIQQTRQAGRVAAELGAGGASATVAVVVGGCTIRANAQCPRAELRRARLPSADLRAANLQGTDLTGADLSGPDLSGADLTGARLDGADFAGAARDACTGCP